MTFLRRNFLLETKTAEFLYQNYAKNLPILDYHNHLNVQHIAEDYRFPDLAAAWLDGDHYKWRAMRAYGVPEKLVTGSSSGKERFLAWAGVLPKLIGSPLYHWSHMELQAYFGITEPLSVRNAEFVWDRCTELLSKPGFTTRGLLRKQKVSVLCTTDDPADSLTYHETCRSNFEAGVYPTFRPERAMLPEKAGFSQYLKQLGSTAGITVTGFATLKQALAVRIGDFHQAGCRISDHSLGGDIYSTAPDSEADSIMQKALEGSPLTSLERKKYTGALLGFLGSEYHRNGWVMQLHIGALRNNSTRMLGQTGTDTGFDSMDDFGYAAQLAGILNELDQKETLPKTILYCLNPKDCEMLAALSGSFQEEGVHGRVQLGAAWWFCDHKEGIERNLAVQAQAGLLAASVGMLTDSRSFLSFPRHDYFRRILCNFLGKQVEDGLYPDDMDTLGNLVEDIVYRNAQRYFEFNSNKLLYSGKE